MAKVKKMASGGLSSLFGQFMSPQAQQQQFVPSGGGSAQEGLGQVQNGASAIAQSLGTASSALDAANNAIGGGGGGGGGGELYSPFYQNSILGGGASEMMTYKKGGAVSYTSKDGKLNLGSGRVSTSKKNSKQPKW